ncbi:helix-turn-helix transcriptional regulator [uncultured Megamonas sp.]|uniref:helix-turn-helix domain-containing protein n=1 Tax=uncultured Megamonas sp. TaxID=286140 RepID=UPI00259BF282|nr:helix-turn-helix transcriptional regulator [uncultured Megamonas sp.]
MNIGERIKNLRISRKISARQLAIKCNVSPAQISMIESSSTNPSLDLLERICNILDISLSDFFIDKQQSLSATQIELMNLSKELSDEQISKIIEVIKVFK